MELSVLSAAREVPQRPALIHNGNVLTYRDLANQVQAHADLDDSHQPLPLVGDNALETLVKVYKLLEIRRPIAMLHPKWTTDERERMIHLVEQGNIQQHQNDEQALAIVPTSGSSSKPRGIILSRRAFLASARASAANLDWHAGDRWLLSLPIAHVGGLSILTRCLAGRRTVVVEENDSFVANDVLHVLRERRVTLLSVVPTMLKRLLTHPAPPSLRAVLVGGAAASSSLLEEALDNAWPVLATYGMTETCSQIATWRPGTRVPTAGLVPLDGIEIRLCDNMIEGIIETRGPQLLSSILPEPATPVLDQDGWFRTPDLGRLDENGFLHIDGRRDRVIISGGENVQAEEVEAVLEAHPHVQNAVVFGVADDEWGEAVAAALTVHRNFDESRLLSQLSERLASFKRPRRLAIIDKFVHLPSGKIDRRATAAAATDFLKPFGKAP